MLEEIPEGASIEFDLILPVDDEICRQNIAESCARQIPDALKRRKVTVIANGPSARNVNLWDIEGPILALNGSIKLFTDKGTWPAFWACCDPQELVADLLPERPPQETIYYVASKCHPAVFRKLKNNNVQIWHISDYPADGKARIPPSSSVTITASWLMARMGFTDFEFWGWDGCFMDGKHHASDDSDWSKVPILNLNYGGKIENGEVVGGRTFDTTRSWAAEARGAEQFFQLAHYFDMRVKIHGDGMFAHAQKFILAA